MNNNNNHTDVDDYGDDYHGDDEKSHQSEKKCSHKNIIISDHRN